MRRPDLRTTRALRGRAGQRGRGLRARGVRRNDRALSSGDASAIRISHVSSPRSPLMRPSTVSPRGTSRPGSSRSSPPTSARSSHEPARSHSRRSSRAQMPRRPARFATITLRAAHSVCLHLTRPLRSRGASRQPVAPRRDRDAGDPSPRIDLDRRVGVEILLERHRRTRLHRIRDDRYRRIRIEERDPANDV